MMKYSTTESEYLMALIKSALTEAAIEPVPDGINWEELITLAKKQQVYSIISAVVDKIDIPQNEYNNLKRYFNSELIRIIAVKSEQELLEEELEANDIDFMLLKGSLLRNYYPKHRMRQMSDVDILYDYSKRDRLLAIMKRYGYTLISWSENSDDFSKEPYYTFEFHHELFFNDLGFCPDFSNVWERSTRDEENKNKHHMSVDDLYLHSIAHMYKHFKLGGFGVRFLCDTYLQLTKDKLDWDYINSRLEEFGLADFEREIRMLTLAVFEGNELDAHQQEVLNSLLKNGVYGDSKVGVQVYFENFKKKHENKKFLLLRYYISKVFPDFEYMTRTYKILKRRPYLLPLFYVKRLFGRTINNRQKIKNDFKILKEEQRKEKKKQK